MLTSVSFPLSWTWTLSRKGAGSSILAGRLTHSWRVMYTPKCIYSIQSHSTIGNCSYLKLACTFCTVIDLQSSLQRTGTIQGKYMCHHFHKVGYMQLQKKYGKEQCPGTVATVLSTYMDENSQKRMSYTPLVSLLFCNRLIGNSHFWLFCLCVSWLIMACCLTVWLLNFIHSFIHLFIHSFT